MCIPCLQLLFQYICGPANCLTLFRTHLDVDSMRWLAPPEKREISLVLICLTVYFLAYNLEMSMEFLGIDPVTTHRVVFGGVGLHTLIGKDGRKPPGWRDQLEMDVYGDWEWNEGHTASDSSQPKITGNYSATWRWKDERYGEVTVNDALQRWGENIPQTQLLKHVPGLCSPPSTGLSRF